MTWPVPSAEHQLWFLNNVQRLLSDGRFVASDKFALLKALADLGHNFVLAHRRCNLRKSDHLAVEERLDLIPA